MKEKMVRECALNGIYLMGVIVAGVELLALAVLPYLLPDVRSTPDSEKVLYFTNVS